jgi:hypothetical protein
MWTDLDMLRKESSGGAGDREHNCDISNYMKTRNSRSDGRDHLEVLGTDQRMTLKLT